MSTLEVKVCLGVLDSTVEVRQDLPAAWVDVEPRISEPLLVTSTLVLLLPQVVEAVLHALRHPQVLLEVLEIAPLDYPEQMLRAQRAVAEHRAWEVAAVAAEVRLVRRVLVELQMQPMVEVVEMDTKAEEEPNRQEVEEDQVSPLRVGPALEVIATALA